MWYTPYWGNLPLNLSKLTPKRMAKFQNNLEFQNFFENYFTLAQDMFVWENLPDTCDERFLERSFLLCGQAMIAKYNDSYISVAAANGADLNIYGYSLKGWGWGLNGFNHEFNLYVPGADTSRTLTEAANGTSGYSTPEAVIGFDNVDKYPYVTYIITACKRMADLIRACDVAVQSLKSPYLITCDEQQLSTVKEALRQREDNVAAIIASKQSISADNFKVWPTAMAPEVLKTFWEQFRNIESQLLEVLGLNSNDNTDKKERLLVDEINANNEVTNAQLAKRLRQREIFAERVNSVFGLNISVHLRDKTYEEEGIVDEPDDIDGLAEGAPGNGPVRRD